MAEEEIWRDILEIPLPNPAVVATPAQEEDPEEDPEEMPEDRTVPTYEADDAVRAEQEVHGEDVTVIDEVFTVMTGLLDRNRELGERLIQYRDHSEQMEAMYEIERDERVLMEGERDEAIAEKQQAEERERALQEKVQQLEDQNRELEARWAIEFENRHEVENIVQDQREDLRIKKRRIDRMTYALRHSYDQIVDRVTFFPVELGQTRQTISRGWVSFIVHDEESEALYNGLIR